MSSEEIFKYVINEFNSIKDIIEQNKNLSPQDVPYVLSKIMNRVSDIQTDMDKYVEKRTKEDSKCEGVSEDV